MSQYNAYILVNAAAKIKEFKEFSGKLYHTMQILTSWSNKQREVETERVVQAEP